MKKVTCTLEYVMLKRMGRGIFKFYLFIYLLGGGGIISGNGRLWVRQWKFFHDFDKLGPLMQQ